MARTAAQTAMSRARTKLLMTKPLLAPGAMRLAMEPSTTVKRAGTDGRSLFYNESWITGLTEDERVGVIAHEVSHLLADHPWRTGSRQMGRWNQACDYVVNNALLDAGFVLPSDALVNPDYKGKSAEQVYALLPEQQPGDPQPAPGIGDFTEPADEDGDGDGDGKDPGQGDQPGDASTGTPGNVPLRDQWKSAAAVSALVAEQMKAGSTAGDLARLIEDGRKSQTPWQVILKEFVENCVPSATSWTRYNKRTAHLGLRLPGTVKENIAPLAVFVDTSGSVDETMLREFGREITTIMDVAEPARIDVVYVDAQVCGMETFYPNNGPVVLDAKGGGGTRFQPAFDWLKEQPEQYAGCLYLTDLECSDRPEDPGIPTLWVVTEGTSRVGPFGTTVRFQREY